MALQTKIKLGEEFAAQAVPLQVQGPRPPYLNNAKLGAEEDQKQQQQRPPQTFLQKYVSFNTLLYFPSIHLYFLSIVVVYCASLGSIHVDWWRRSTTRSRERG